MPIHNSYNIRTTPLAEPQDQKGDAGETQWLVWKQLPSKDLTAGRRGVTSFWHTAAGNPSLRGHNPTWVPISRDKPNNYSLSQK